MSETEHYKGVLTPTCKSVEEYMKGVELPSYYDCAIEYFKDDLSESAVEIDGLVWEVTREWYEDSDDIFESSNNSDGTIAFQVKYYNGGCGFGEALEEALGNIK